MFKNFLLLGVLSLSIISCSDSSEDLANKKAIGGAVYGGEFRFMSAEKIQTLLPLLSTDIYSSRVSSQIFDPILMLNPSNNKVEPSLAESYTVSPDGKVYTLKIRKGVYFQNDDCFDGDGREMTAEDVKFTLDMACSGLKLNEVSHLLIERIAGAEKYYKATRNDFVEGGVSGITAPDNNTVKITLNEPFAGFDKLLCFSGFGVFPKEAYDTYGNDLPQHPVGTGPFVLAENTKDYIKLDRNPNYWKKDEFGNQLPYLGSVRVTYSTNKSSELKAFRDSKIDLVLEIPADEVDNILGSLSEAQAGKTVKHKVDSQASASLTFVGFNHDHKALSDKRVRMAMNLAIDRNFIVNNQLMGEGYPDTHGVIPNCSFYDASGVKGYTFNVNKAKALMAEAGYENGKGFPQLNLVVNGKKGDDREVYAKSIVKQLYDNLGIIINMKLVDSKKRDNMLVSGTADMWTMQWIADYPDGENFLALYYSGKINTKSKFINTFHYKSSEFNATFQNMNRESDVNKRHDLMVKADQIIVNDAVIMPILTDDFIILYNARIRNLETNALEIFDLSTIFIKELRE